MTDDEKQVIVEAIKKNAPDWYERIKQNQSQKRDMILSCLHIASRNYSADYQDEINQIYNACRSRLSEVETILLNYLCLIKYKEHLNNGNQKQDAEIQKWLGILQRYVDDESVIGVLAKLSQKVIKQYKVKKVGRPKGKGKQVFTYNGKEYHTIQECADEYGISKQGMHKRLRKLHVINERHMYTVIHS